MLKNKKSVQEILSFVLLLGVVITVATYAYMASKDILDNKIAEKELEKASDNMFVLQNSIREVNGFSGNKKTLKMSFNKGIYKFTSDKITYYSDLRRNVNSTNAYCQDNVCEKIQNYNIIKYINLSTLGVTVLTSTITLDPGVYNIVLKNENNRVEIEVE